MSIEILQPSLEPTRTIKLWTPNTIGTLTFFIGFPAGITLASINWFKMGLKRKAFINILTGMIGIVAIYFIPENLTRSIALVINLGFVAYIRYQMKADIESITDYKVENAHWVSGFLYSILVWTPILAVIFIVSFLQPFIPGTASYHYAQGNYYSDNGDEIKAIENYNKAIELDPKDIYSYNNRGLSYINLGKYESAIADFNKAMELDPNYDKPYFNRALAYEELGQIDNAIRDFQKVLELTTDSTLQKYSEDELEKLKTFDSSTANGSLSHYDNGEKHYLNGEYEKAIIELTNAIELNPNYVDAYHYRANAYMNLGKYDLALADLDKAISISPDNAFLYYIRGLFYKEIGDFDKVLADQNKAISIDPQYGDAYLERGVAYGNLGDHENALADFSKAIELNPNNPLFFYNRGSENFTLGKYDQAIKDFNKAIELDPEYVDAYNNRGVAYAVSGNRKQAISDFDKVIELKPNDTQAYFNRGLTYKTLGQINEAISDFERAFELSTDPEARKEIEDILKELRKQ